VSATAGLEQRQNKLRRFLERIEALSSLVSNFDTASEAALKCPTCARVSLYICSFWPCGHVYCADCIPEPTEAPDSDTDGGMDSERQHRRTSRYSRRTSSVDDDADIFAARPGQRQPHNNTHHHSGNPHHHGKKTRSVEAACRVCGMGSRDAFVVNHAACALAARMNVRHATAGDLTVASGRLREALYRGAAAPSTAV
jgi:hypothetical protein